MIKLNTKDLRKTIVGEIQEQADFCFDKPTLHSNISELLEMVKSQLNPLLDHLKSTDYQEGAQEQLDDYIQRYKELFNEADEEFDKEKKYELILGIPEELQILMMGYEGNETTNNKGVKNND